MKFRRRLVEDEKSPLTDAEIDALRRHINIPLLSRALRTIDELKTQLAERDQLLRKARTER
jgi:hypothetical protein